MLVPRQDEEGIATLTLDRPAKALLATHAGRSRSDALLIERGLPFGMPEDRKERMSGRGSKKAKGRGA